MPTAVRKVYTLGGEEVTDPSGFQNGSTYVAVGRIRFKQMGYRPAPPSHSTNPVRILPPISRPSPIKRKSPQKKKPVPPPPKPPAVLPPPKPKPAPPPKKPEPPKIRPQSYMITIETMNETSAGTTAQVSITLYGSKGTSGAQVLNDDPDNFGAGASDTFAVECVPLGEVQRLRLEHDSTGPDSAWKVGRISIRDAVKNTTSYFHCNRWLASDRGSFETVIELSATNDQTPPNANELLVAGATEDDIFAASASGGEDADIIDDSEETAVDIPVDMEGAAAIEDSDGELDTDIEEAAAAAVEEATAAAAAAVTEETFVVDEAEEKPKLDGNDAVAVAVEPAQEATDGITGTPNVDGEEAGPAETGAAAEAEVELEEAGTKTEAEATSEEEGEEEEDVDAVSPLPTSVEDAEKDAAVREIQAAFRGHQARKESGAAVQAAKEQHALETQAATKIQAGFRGHKARKVLNEKNKAVLEIQAAMKGWQARKQLETVAAFQSAVGAETDEMQAAIIIQSRWRGYVARKQLREKELAVREIQAAFRGHMSRSEMENYLAEEQEKNEDGEGAANDDSTDVAPSDEGAAEPQDAPDIVEGSAAATGEEAVAAALKESPQPEGEDTKEPQAEESTTESLSPVGNKDGLEAAAAEGTAGAVEASSEDAEEKGGAGAPAAPAVADDDDNDNDDDDDDIDDDALEMLEAAAAGHLARQQAKDKIEAIQQLQANVRGGIARKRLLAQQGSSAEATPHDVTLSGAEHAAGSE